MSRPSPVPRRRALTLAAGLAATAALPVSARAQDNVRYAGYSAADHAEPYARFMAERTAPPQATVTRAYTGPPTPAARIPPFDTLVGELAPHGYSAVETGFGCADSGVVWVAVHTPMPRVTAAMWDWWFGWHLVQSARYKLWHPDAHMYAEVATDHRDRQIPDRQRYIGNVSYVDEYIGPELQQLAIAFHDPRALGFTVPDGHTVIVGRVGSAVAPIDLGWLAHQVRPVPGGAEMRSRFYLRMYGTHAPDPAHAVRAVERGPAADPTDLVPGLDTARDLMLHCGQEMNHLARFLPELYAEFGR